MATDEHLESFHCYTLVSCDFDEDKTDDGWGLELIIHLDGRMMFILPVNRGFVPFQFDQNQFLRADPLHAYISNYQPPTGAALFYDVLYREILLHGQGKFIDEGKSLLFFHPRATLDFSRKTGPRIKCTSLFS